MPLDIHLDPYEAGNWITRSNGHWGVKDQFGKAVTVTYGYADSTYVDYISAFSSAQIDAAELALQLWSDVANITFSRLGKGNSGTAAIDNTAAILLFNFNDSTGAYSSTAGNTGQPGNPGNTAADGGEGNVGINAAIASNATLDYGSYGFQTMLHEIGHAIGLSHPGAYNATDSTSASYADAIYYEDTRQYTLMSYFNANNTGANHVAGTGDLIFGATPLLDDITAVQRLYGANYNTRRGDTTYGFHSNADRDVFHIDKWNPQQVVFAIWDGGGNDTLDFSGYNTNQIIDLNPGAFSSVGELTNNVVIAALHIDDQGVADKRSMIENAIGGGGNDTMMGNELKNVLTGNGGNDILDGRGGADTMRGGFGNDTYYVAQFGDVASEIPHKSSGTDQVYSWIPGYTLPNRIENLRMFVGGIGSGNALDNVIVGNGDFNDLRGRDGNDTLDGGGGVDILDGGKGNDSYFVDNIADAVIEHKTKRVGTHIIRYGTDTIFSSIDFSLTPEANRPQGPLNVENLTLLPGGAVSGTGNALGNIIVGNGNNNVLRGLAGDDQLFGGDGADTLEGGAGDDALQGEAGADIMRGGSGSDGYFVDDVGDQVIEENVFGIDRVFSSLHDYTLGAWVENLVLSNGTAATNGTGNALANVINGNGNDNHLYGLAGDDTLYGGAGQDVLDGGANADTMYGGDDNDRYLVDQKGDKVVELAGGGNFDQVDSMVSYRLPKFVEVLVLEAAGGVIDGTGNRLANTIHGNSSNNVLKGLGGDDNLQGFDGDDTLNGSKGADIMIGGTGNDKYYVDNPNDQVIETDNDALFHEDTVLTRVQLPGLPDFIENMTLLEPLAAKKGQPHFAGAMNATGNALNNILIGNSMANTLTGLDGNDTLDGKGGKDTLIGGEGSDIYHLRQGDTLIETGSTPGDRDMVISYLTVYTLADEMEDLALAPSSSATFGTGNDKDNNIYGNEQDNLLSGKGGNDYLVGGKGKDTLFGGAGSDSFVFTRLSDGGDKIQDFVHLEDKIVFEHEGFGFLEQGVSLVEGQNFVSGVNPHAANNGPTILYDTKFHDIYFAVNGGVTFMANLGNGANLTIDDFFIG